MEERIAVEPSSGNVFADLGFEDAEELFVKSGLIVHILHAIETMHLTEAVAAERMEVEQSFLNDLLRGDAFETTIDRLLVLLNRLGQNVEIVVSPVAPGEQEAKVTVRSGGERAAA